MDAVCFRRIHIYATKGVFVVQQDIPLSDLWYMTGSLKAKPYFEAGVPNLAFFMPFKWRNPGRT